MSKKKTESMKRDRRTEKPKATERAICQEKTASDERARFMEEST
jgi:hypothetical protein